MGFRLNTSPAGSDDNSPADSIEESFWQTHLWPLKNHINHQSHPPRVDVDHNVGFAFPVLDGGEHAVVEAAPVKEEEEKTSPTTTIDSRKKRGLDEDGNNDHVNGERERRKKMRSMFDALQSYLPHLSPKIDKATIVQEAINLIKTLEISLQDLQQKAYNLQSHPPKAAIATFEPPSTTGLQLKLAGQTTRESFLADYGLGPTSMPNGPNHDEHGNVMFQTWTSSNVVLNTYGKNEALIMACSRKKRGVLTAIVDVLVKHGVEVEGLHAFSNGDQCSYMIHARLANGACGQHLSSNAEDVYKEAVRELMLLVMDNFVKGEA